MPDGAGIFKGVSLAGLKLPWLDEDASPSEDCSCDGALADPDCKCAARIREQMLQG